MTPPNNEPGYVCRHDAQDSWFLSDEGHYGSVLKRYYPECPYCPAPKAQENTESGKCPLCDKDRTHHDHILYCQEAMKAQADHCPHVYESDCHAIEMIKSPNGREYAIGGTDHPSRWKYDPWCGKPLPTSAQAESREALLTILRPKMIEIRDNETYLAGWYIELDDLMAALTKLDKGGKGE